MRPLHAGSENVFANIDMCRHHYAEGGLKPTIASASVSNTTFIAVQPRQRQLGLKLIM